MARGDRGLSGKELRKWLYTCVHMSVYTHAYLQAHMCTHHRGSEIPVSGQKGKLPEEWFVAGCQQLWARGQSMPLCPSLQNQPYSPWNLLLYTLGLFCGAGPPWQGSRGRRGFSWRGESPEIPVRRVWNGPEHENLGPVFQESCCAPGWSNLHWKGHLCPGKRVSRGTMWS